MHMKKIFYLFLIFLVSADLLGQGISMGGGSATGKNSFGFGTNTTASGTASIAGGINSIANDTASVAIGEDSEARGKYAIALGKVAYVNAANAVAIGSYCNVQSQYSLAFGLNNVIPQNSWYSTAIGAGNFATKDGAIAVGRDNRAEGLSSVAIGTQNTAHSFGEVVLGTWAGNYTPLNPFGKNPKDRLFVLGNGESHEARSNALVVLKSGDASYQGGITLGSPNTTIDTDKDTKLVVYGSTVLSESGEIDDQILMGTNVLNNESKVFITNAGFPYALMVDGFGSSSGKAVYIDGGMEIIGNVVARNAIAVEGDLNVAGTLSKGAGTFKIDHPLDPQNKYLYHSFVESPDMMNVYNGNVITDKNGDATVELPEYFESLNTDFRYQLTTIGQFAQAIVLEKVIGNQFKIKTDKPNVEVSWQVTGIRNDAYARQNRVKVSVDKPEKEKGTYLHPKAFSNIYVDLN